MYGKRIVPVLLLALLTLAACGTEEEEAYGKEYGSSVQASDYTVGETVRESETELFRTNLDGLSVYPEAGTIRYPCAAEDTALGGGLLFVNGMLADANAVYDCGGVLYVSLNTVCDILGDRLTYRTDSGACTEVTVNGVTADAQGMLYRNDTDTVYVLPEDIPPLLGAEVTLYDGAEIPPGTEAPRMVEGVPNIMVSRYPADAVKATSEEAAERLRGELILAYERKFGPYEPLYEKPDGYVSDGYNLRYEIANLSPAAENDRFYIVPLWGYYYVDKFTGDIYRYYDGMDQSFYLFDPLADSALAFAG